MLTKKQAPRTYDGGNTFWTAGDSSAILSADQHRDASFGVVPRCTPASRVALGDSVPGVHTNHAVGVGLLDRLEQLRHPQMLLRRIKGRQQRVGGRHLVGRLQVDRLWLSLMHCGQADSHAAYTADVATLLCGGACVHARRSTCGMRGCAVRAARARSAWAHRWRKRRDRC